jgi:hypothetical protein
VVRLPHDAHARREEKEEKEKQELDEKLKLARARQKEVAGKLQAAQAGKEASGPWLTQGGGYAPLVLS